MAVTKGSVVSSHIGNNIYEDSDANSTAEYPDGSSGTIYQVKVDNSSNTSASYLKVYDTTGSVTVGTTVPDFIFPCAASTTAQYDFPQGIAYASGLKFACVTAAGTAGTTSPSSAVAVKITVNT